jgi:zinc D-Ala-D-Ala carboxypeptidase
VSEQNATPPAASEYRGRRRAQPTPDADAGSAGAEVGPVEPPPLTRRQLLEQRRAAERAEAEQTATAGQLAEGEPGDSPEPAAEQPRADQPTERGNETIPQPRPATVVLPTRRQLAEQRRARGSAEAAGRGRARSRERGRGPRLTAVALGTATVAAVAVGAGHAFGAPPAQISSAAEIAGAVAATQQLSPKVSSSAVMAALRTGPSFDLPLGVRASRSSNRPVLPGCTGDVTDYTYANGHVPSDELCALAFAPGHHLRADAAVALARLNIAYRARFGHNLCLTDSYRTIASQESLAARKPGLAAVPGTSEHGMGLAVDFCDGVQAYRSVEYNWMRANAPAFGWQNPAWAIPPSSREEPWHWEYVVGEAKTHDSSES